jgi:DNA topoisomerase-1
MTMLNEAVREAVRLDPKAEAKAARLRYVNDGEPGIRRKRAGRGFQYIGTNGERIIDTDELERIRALAIPPAWTEVWICPYPNGHIQATGRDSKGRKQYCYHERWATRRSVAKFQRMIQFGEALPTLRERAEHDLSLPGLPLDKVLAAIVKLMDMTAIRVGNQEYARNNRSYGLTTLRDRHVNVNGATIQFRFKGKSGIPHTVDLQDRRLARIIQRSKDVPGQELFQYLNDERKPVDVHAEDVNGYLRQAMQQDFTAKDFRTWNGTLLAIMAFQESGTSSSTTQVKRNVSRAIQQVAARLGNTPTVCRKYYVHPAVVDAYTEGLLLDALAELTTTAATEGLCAEENVALALLRKLDRSDAQV